MKGISNVFCWFETSSSNILTSDSYLYGFNKNTVFLQCNFNKFKPIITKTVSDFAYKLDKKYDDSLYNSGDFRAVCCGDYQRSIKNKCSCGFMSYVVWKYEYHSLKLIFTTLD